MNGIATAIGNRLSRTLRARGLARLVASIRGRAFQLSFMADAEESDEGVFDEMLARVDDPTVQKMVRIHRDDERRHANLLRGCIERLGVTPEAVPPELRYIQRIDRLLGGGIQAFLHEQHGVMEVYVILQVVEERGVEQFTQVVDALRCVDPESAAVVAAIVRDERRHVKFARAISTRYAPDRETLERMLQASREVEARAFDEHSRDFLRFMLERDLLAVPVAERLFWRALVAASSRRRGAPMAEHAAT